MGWRSVVGAIGRVLIGAGVLLLLFVAYQLWGTGLAEARSQDDLQDQFAALLADAGPAAATTTTTAPAAPTTSVPSATATVATTTAPTTTPAPFLQEGDAVAHLEIPRIGVDKIVVAGVGVSDLRRGPGHYPSTPLPGQLGNAAIAGHRTTYGAPFFHIDELGPGDEIFVTTTAGRFRYLVTEQRIVAPTDLSVLDPTPDATLTLTACHPRYSARQRIVVKAVLEPDPVVPPAVPTGPAYVTDDRGGDDGGDDEDVVGPPATATGGAATPSTAVVADGDHGAVTGGWFSEPAAWPPTIFWALLCTGVAVGAWWVGRRWRRWASYLIATPVFLVLLYLCFGQVTRLLPPNL